MTTLSDVDIKVRIGIGELVLGAELARVGPACYELRMGKVYYDLTELGDQRIELVNGQNVLIKPGHRVVLITEEELNVPNDIIARVTSKGSLFSIGLSPVSTYADPGFKGALGVVTQNLSDKYIQISAGEPIAKVDFSVLSSPAQSPYHGQHGFQTQIWPIKHHLQKTFEDVKNDTRVESELEEAYKILPKAMSSVLRTLQRKQRFIDFGILFVVCLNMLLLAGVSSKFFEPIVSVITNLISSALIGLMMWIQGKRR